MELLTGSNRSVRSPFQPGIRWSPGFVAIAIVIVIASSTLAFGQAGTLDPTYGSGGLATVFSQASGNLLTAAAIQADDKVVMVGTNPGDVLVRLNTNGTLDASFGTNGVVSENFNVLGPPMAVVIQPNQQILQFASGFLGTAIARFNSDGSMDTTFGTGGFASTRLISNGASAIIPMALQSNGSILIGGNGLIARFTSSGQLDTTFGTTGIAPLTNRTVTGIAIQSDGKISGFERHVAAAGTIWRAKLLPSPAAAPISCHISTGSLDTIYGITGSASCVAVGGGYGTAEQRQAGCCRYRNQWSCPDAERQQQPNRLRHCAL